MNPYTPTYTKQVVYNGTACEIEVRLHAETEKGLNGNSFHHLTLRSAAGVHHHYAVNSTEDLQQRLATFEQEGKALMESATETYPEENVLTELGFVKA